MTPVQAIAQLETLLTGVATVIVGMDIDNYPSNGAVPVIFIRPDSITETDRDDQATRNTISVTIEYVTNEQEPTDTLLSAWEDITAGLAIRIRKLQITALNAQLNYRVAGGTFSTVAISATLSFVNNFADPSEVY